MKNYICIEGKKAELTKEQLEKLGISTEPTIELSEDGEIAKIGDYEFIVLNKEDEYSEVKKLLLKDILQESEFGKNNDYRQSYIKPILENFTKEITKIIGVSNLLPHTVDLTADDGLKDYGNITAKMSLLTAQMYRENVYTLDKYKIEYWWWLVTPHSTPTHDNSIFTKCVSPDGRINGFRYDFDFGVRPFCIVKSCIFEK